MRRAGLFETPSTPTAPTHDCVVVLRRTENSSGGVPLEEEQTSIRRTACHAD